MQTNGGKNTISLSRKLLGEPTPAKVSGLAYSLAALLPAVASFIAMAVFAACGLLREGYQTQNWFLYFNFLFPQLCFGVTAFVVLRYAKVSLRDAVKSQKCPWRYFLIAFLMQIGLFSLSELNTLFLEFLENFGYTPSEILLPDTDGFGFVGALIVVALLPAVFEEILFRGVLLNGIKSFGEVGAAIVCGALFSLYHQNPPQTIYQFCCGVAFAFVAIRAGSILPTVLTHFFNNALILVLYKWNIQTFPSPVYIAYICVAVVCLLAAAWLLYRDRKKNPKPQTSAPPEGERKRFFLFAGVGMAVCALTWLLVLLTGM